MTATGEGKGRRALVALSDLARRSARPPTPAQLDSGLRAVRSRLDDAQPKKWRAFSRRRTVLLWTVLGILAATSALVVLSVVRSARPRAPLAQPALSYRLEGGNLIEGGYLRESGPSGIRAVFSEGTEFILMPGTRSRLRAVDASGARITIEHGAASFQVTPANDRRWQVDVGRFLVTVKGTAFTDDDGTGGQLEASAVSGEVPPAGKSGAF